VILVAFHTGCYTVSIRGLHIDRQKISSYRLYYSKKKQEITVKFSAGELKIFTPLMTKPGIRQLP
jgi:hypothetical protein